jgi:hypothetical protein
MKGLEKIWILERKSKHVANDSRVIYSSQQKSTCAMVEWAVVVICHLLSIYVNFSVSVQSNETILDRDHHCKEDIQSLYS